MIGNLFTVETFRTDSSVRHDLAFRGHALYGAGWMRGYFGGMPGVAHYYHLNAYRWAPVSFRWLNMVGWFEKPLWDAITWRRRVGVHYTGSIREPWSAWHLRVGRVFVGGDTPRFVQAWLRRRELRKWDDAAFAGDYDSSDDTYYDDGHTGYEG